MRTRCIGLTLILLMSLALSGCGNSSNDPSKLTEKEKQDFKGHPNATPQEQAAVFQGMKERWKAKHPNDPMIGPDTAPSQTMIKPSTTSK